VIRTPQIHDASASCGAIDSLYPIPDQAHLRAKDRFYDGSFPRVRNRQVDGLVRFGFAARYL